MYAKSIRPSAKREVQEERSVKRDNQIARWECARGASRFFYFIFIRATFASKIQLWARFGFTLWKMWILRFAFGVLCVLYIRITKFVLKIFFIFRVFLPYLIYFGGEMEFFIFTKTFLWILPELLVKNDWLTNLSFLFGP